MFPIRKCSVLVRALLLILFASALSAQAPPFEDEAKVQHWLEAQKIPVLGLVSGVI